ncbi:hypothetical protein BDV32DRAFT_50211 [Aspergillus pseudonomiae]|nr:hypothetical protein BDV32DRAFT_50211 [Aspergillus pseudonomiae]
MVALRVRYGRSLIFSSFVFFFSSICDWITSVLSSDTLYLCSTLLCVAWLCTYSTSHDVFFFFFSFCLQRILPIIVLHLFVFRVRG